MQEPGVPIQTSEKLVLVVEDDPNNLEVIRLVLEDNLGVATIVATNGQQALEQTLTRHPDLILLDLMIPNLDGFEVVRRLKADPASRDVPVIAVSAWTWDRAREMALELGCDDFVAKPFDANELAAKAASYLVVELPKDH